ncbi:alpha/beta hydrolase [Candidatus Cardinium hertigii]|nr:alpha/beta hydrolase [Candidatus Cardinium hertigii]
MDPSQAQPIGERTIAATLANPTLLRKSTQATFGMVLLHGLSMDRKEMQMLANELSEKYKDNLLIINSSVREQGISEDYSIDQQVEMVYQEIQTTLRTYHKDSQSFPLFILGQSQGGIIATLIAKRYKHTLHLLGFITHNAPLQGAAILTRGPLAIQHFKNKAKNGLNIIGTKVNWSLFALAALAKTADCIYPLLQGMGYKKFAGIKDTLPNRPCTSAVYHYLRNSQPSDRVPGLLIAGYQNDYGRLFRHTITAYKEAHQALNINEKVDQAIQALNEATALLVTGETDGLHDHLIPLQSQLCRGDSLEDLTHIGNTPYAIGMPGNPAIQCFVIRDITHCNDIFPISRREIEAEEYMMHPHRMLPLLFQFIEEKLAACQP